MSLWACVDPGSPPPGYTDDEQDSETHCEARGCTLLAVGMSDQGVHLCAACAVADAAEAA